MRIAAGLLVVIASIAAVSSSIGSTAQGIGKNVSGPGNCRSLDRSPVFGEEGSEVSVSVTGRVTCASQHTRLEIHINLWERQRSTGKWIVAGSAKGGSINSRVARVEASISCVPSSAVNQFQVSMRSKVDNLKPKVIRRYPIQRVSQKVACPS